MLPSAATYDELVARFAWRVPARYNIGVDVCDRHAAARPDAPALIFEDENGTVATWSFAQLKAQTDRFANLLAAHGLVRGDRVAVLLPQSPETAVAHIGSYKAGMIAVPLFVLFGEDALEYRLADCGAACVVTDTQQLPKL
ncbi:MAG: acyl-CoA synthetase, partial [Rhodospirillales bacterium]|nr:acyl-CoA synthetase [Rhodospirillales bacterium]